MQTKYILFTLKFNNKLKASNVLKEMLLMFTQTSIIKYETSINCMIITK